VTGSPNIHRPRAVLSPVRGAIRRKILSFRITPLALAFVMGGGLAVPTRIRAQDPSDSALTAPRPDSLASYVPHAPPADGNAVHWYVPLAVAGGIGLLSTIDQPVADHFRIHRSSGGQNVADAWSRIGTPVVYGPVTVGVIAGGLIAHDPEVTKAGLRLAFSLALAGVANQGLKAVVGRERPIQSTNAFDFDPIHIDASFPSGHTTMAFAMATSLADDVHPTWAKVGLYGLATGVAVSRVISSSTGYPTSSEARRWVSPRRSSRADAGRFSASGPRPS
jgi:membrane-associated phospholipid phosphatase